MELVTRLAILLAILLAIRGEWVENWWSLALPIEEEV
jgi:hypothetical protein